MTQAETKVPAIVLTRQLGAAPERVYDAWLSTSWGEWAGPQGVRGDVVLMEPRIGGRYRVVMHLPNGNTLTVGGVYRELTRPAKIVMSWKWEHEDADTTVTLTFRAKDQGTELTLHHEGFANAERRDSHAGGWAGTLDKLAAYLATG
jgi:uncharacterized protein YndB with AHSA1/START domain